MKNRTVSQKSFGKITSSMKTSLEQQHDMITQKITNALKKSPLDFKHLMVKTDMRGRTLFTYLRDLRFENKIHVIHCERCNGSGTLYALKK